MPTTYHLNTQTFQLGLPHSIRVTAANLHNWAKFSISFIQNLLSWQSNTFLMYLQNTFYSAQSHTTTFTLNLHGLPTLPQPITGRPNPMSTSTQAVLDFFGFWFSPPHGHTLSQSPSLKSLNAHSPVRFQHTLSLTNGGSTELLRAVQISYLRFSNHLLKDLVGILK